MPVVWLTVTPAGNTVEGEAPLKPTVPAEPIEGPDGTIIIDDLDGPDAGADSAPKPRSSLAVAGDAAKPFAARRGAPPQARR